MGSCLRARAKGASTISATAATMSGGGRMSERDTKTALITGVLGQDGSYLAELLAAKGYRVIGTSHRGAQRTRLAGPAREIEVLGLDLADGEAKVLAQNMVEAYRERYGLFACTAVLFNHESPRRGLDYVTRKITSTAARIKAGLEDSLVLGNLDGRRDWSFAGDVVHAMWLMLEQPEPGDFVLASGETHSVNELCELAFGRLGLDYRKHVVVDPRQGREADAVELRGDSGKARLQLGWRPTIGFKELVYMMVDADYEALSPSPVPGENPSPKGRTRA